MERLQFMTIERAVYWPGIGLTNFTDSSLGEDNLIRMFNRFLSRVSYEANSSRCLWPLFSDQFDRGFAEVHKQFGKNDKYILALIQELFGSAPNHPGAYVDTGFIDFCQRYFSRTFSPEFLAYLDGLYFSIAEDKRITWDGSKILSAAE